MPARLTGPRAYLNAISRGVARLVMEEWRALPLYQRLVLRGTVPDTLKARPRHLRPADPEAGQAILEGRFQLAGLELNVGEGGDPWAVSTPSRRFAERLHAFEWMRDLLAVQDPAARKEARRLTDLWIDEFGRGFNVFAWSPGLSAERLRNWLVAARDLFADEDSVRRSRRFYTLASQARHVARSGGETADGLPRLIARSSAALASVCLDWPQRRQTRLFDTLGEEVDNQILEDGVHASRSPEATLEAMIELSLLEDALFQRDMDPPEGVARALARLGPALHFFRHADGGLAAFNGGGAGDRATIEDALARDEPPKRIFAVAPHAKFLRARAHDAIVIMDGGASPPAAFSDQAHGGALSFEFSAQGQRLIVNCGWSPDQPAAWREPVRSTAAHSTLTVAETSSSRLVPPGPGRAIAGPKLKIGSNSLSAKAREEEAGAWLDGAHDGYLKDFGLIHRRRLYLSADGNDLRGEDTLDVPAPGSQTKTRTETLSFAIRFHLPPGVKASISRDGASAILATARGDGWRFRTDHPPIRIERSAFLAAGAPPARSEQLVIYGVIPRKAEKGQSLVCVRWALQRQGTEE